jgi:hypothetical protein
MNLGRFRFSRAQSNVQSLWCFYNIHEVSSTVLANPFLNYVGTPIKQGDTSVRRAVTPCSSHAISVSRKRGRIGIEIIQHQNIQ